ncbi:tRNA (guanine-N1)-methyltransferase [Saccharicrinis sp. GN24d3]|uniref:tRNA (guanine-N1)-methyltransferase n=1 Tax=Saccharicrinis sp. GN24d3 TaxID=3458416 RepID=UPI0040354CC6
MKKLITSTLFVLLFFIGQPISLNAQESGNSGLEGGTIGSQFDYAIKKSNTFEAFKVVRTSWLYKLKGNAIDSVKALQKNIVSLENKVQDQQKEVNVLKSNLRETNEKLELATKEKDSFSFLGMLLTKGVYGTMVWTIIFSLIVALLIMIFLFNRSNTITIKTKETLGEKQEEFDAHRKWALEREQTLARELNKLKQKYKGLD